MYIEFTLMFIHYSILHKYIERMARPADSLEASEIFLFTEVRLEVKWYLRTRDLDSEPFIAFVVRGRNSSLAYLMELRTNEFKILSLDLNPM